MILEHVAAAAGAGREIDMGCAVKIEFVVDQNAAFIRPGEATKAIEGERFAGTACAPEDGGGGVALEMNVELKGWSISHGREAFEEAGVNLYRRRAHPL
jgi:hypothetical protein